MKTHRIILPRDQHVAVLAGVDRLLLPLDRAAKARLSEADGLVIESADYFTGAPERGLAWYWKGRGCWNSTEPFFPPYKPGDRLALLEPTRTFGRQVAYEYDMEQWEFEGLYDSRTPASRMSLAACRCFYRVSATLKGAFVRVEPALQPKLSDQNASGVVGAWVWGVPVEREGECHT